MSRLPLPARLPTDPQQKYKLSDPLLAQLIEVSIQEHFSSMPSPDESGNYSGASRTAVVSEPMKFCVSSINGSTFVSGMSPDGARQQGHLLTAAGA